MRTTKEILTWITDKKKLMRKYTPSSMGITIGTLTELEQFIMSRR